MSVMFYNESLDCPNALEIDVDYDLIKRQVTDLIYLKFLAAPLRDRLRQTQEAFFDTRQQLTERIKITDTRLDVGETAPLSKRDETSPPTVDAADGSKLRAQTITEDGCEESDDSQGHGFYVTSPGSHWGSDIQWVSVDNDKTYRHFEKLFRDLKVKESMTASMNESHSIGMVNWDSLMDSKDFRIYSAFFVVRSWCQTPFFHHDFGSGAEGKAFTLMTPIVATEEASEIEVAGSTAWLPSASLLAKTAAAGKCHLLYRSGYGNNEKPIAETKRQYTYRPGKAVVFGHGFWHATQDGSVKECMEQFGVDSSAAPPFVFLCFTFGSRNPLDWEKIGPYAGSQGRVHWRPCGRKCSSIPVRRGDYDDCSRVRRVEACERDSAKFRSMLEKELELVRNGEAVVEKVVTKLKKVLENIEKALDSAINYSWYFDESQSNIPGLVTDFRAALSELEGGMKDDQLSETQCRFTGRPWEDVYREISRIINKEEGAPLMQFSHSHNHLLLVDNFGTDCYHRAVPDNVNRGAQHRLPPDVEGGSCEEGVSVTSAVSSSTRPPSDSAQRINDAKSKADFLVDASSKTPQLTSTTRVAGVYCSKKIVTGGVVEISTARHLYPDDELPVEFHGSVFIREARPEAEMPLLRSMIFGTGSYMRVAREEETPNVTAVVIEESESCILYALRLIIPGDELVLEKRGFRYSDDTSPARPARLFCAAESISQQLAPWQPSEEDLPGKTVPIPEQFTNVLNGENKSIPWSAQFWSSPNYSRPSIEIPVAGLGVFARGHGRHGVSKESGRQIAYVKGEIVEVDPCLCFDFLNGADPKTLTRYVYGDADRGEFCEYANIMLGFGSLTNHGGKMADGKTGLKGGCNVEGYAIHKVGVFTVFKALRDIELGEELYTDYGDTPTC